ncbi:MBL fold hydrolase [Phytomonospora endophytica]|nr:MBL fold hydrolase [Phytomonospora endophytica]
MAARRTVRQTVRVHSIERLSGRVWLYPGDADAANIQGSVAVITGDDGSVVVDAGHSPAVGSLVRRAMREAGLPDARWLVYTHHHWDHTWGARAWDGVEIIGHASGAEILGEEAKRPWSEEYLRAGMVADPLLEPSYSARIRAMAGSWEGFAILPPTRVFTDSLTLPYDVEVRHVGGGHAPDSTVVVVPDASVMLLGDSFYAPPFHVRKADDTTDLAMVRRFLSEGYEWYVDSHSPPRRRGGWSAAAGLMTATGRFRRRPRGES